MGKLWHGEVKSHAQGHATRREQIWDSNSSSLAPKPLFPIPRLPMTLDESFRLHTPQFPHLQNGAGVKSNELIYVKYLGFFWGGL